MTRPDVVLGVVAIALVASALRIEAQVNPLNISETVAVSEERALSIREPMKCSEDGHIYVQFVNGGPESQINIISNDGKEVHWASLSETPELQPGYVRDFAPESTGGVYLLVQVSREQHFGPDEQSAPLDRFYIARFDDHGKFVSAMKLDADFQVEHFAVFSNGNEFVVTGYRGKDLHGPHQELSPVTALFSSNGEVLRYVSLPRDVNSRSVTQHIHDGKALPLTELQIIDLSFLQDGEDGNVYLVRGTPTGPVYSISPGSDVHRIELSPPRKDGTLLTLKVAQAEILAEYMLPKDSPKKPGTLLLVVFDRKGHVRRQYSISGREAGLGMACYADHGLTFLAASKNGSVELRRAQMR